jgi:hypothetical protein
MGDMGIVDTQRNTTQVDVLAGTWDSLTTIGLFPCIIGMALARHGTTWIVGALIPRIIQPLPQTSVRHMHVGGG